MTEKLHITQRELDVWRAVADGLTMNQTATKLGISRATVGQYRKTLYQAIHVHSAVGAALAAVAHGVVLLVMVSIPLVVTGTPRKKK